MEILAHILTALVALEHFYILYLEMFAIEGKSAKRIFGLTDDFIAQQKVKVMFANQGLYNGFLAAGIIFGYAIQQMPVIYFFLTCVIIAAIFGATTANKGIFVKQGLPTVLALVLQVIIQG
ncbi:hypothetical protein BKG95_08590 [Rodentibacter pneumotropicus]|uniref:DUF1304 domain-containing protein n=1 Tax=Rodentibacter pneumotropicus TaxID=758 RepID=A0AAW5L6I8_9PAST|nr:DUF1304 domain-containing protein [Rodentibacter pneumotropicus]MCQ9120270.1 DUF1304 domain-containing protein [Rodentibacter pneumotropicus]OOF67098.1 hypothetical protein BKG95_08590 [Rodentibacter pneumotropicus]